MLLEWLRILITGLTSTLSLLNLDSFTTEIITEIIGFGDGASPVQWTEGAPMSTNCGSLPALVHCSVLDLPAHRGRPGRCRFIHGMVSLLTTLPKTVHVSSLWIDLAWQIGWYAIAKAILSWERHLTLVDNMIKRESDPYLDSASIDGMHAGTCTGTEGTVRPCSKRSLT